MQVRSQFYINGQGQGPSGTTLIEVVSPHTEASIGTVPEGTAADIDAAVAAARAAFDHGPWPRLPLAERAGRLRRFAGYLREHRAAIARTIAREGGFPIARAEPVHVVRGADFVDYFAGLIEKTVLEEERQALAGRVQVRREPVGVVGAIVRWNIPLIGALSKLAPALAAGCTAVLKPSPETPLSSYFLAEAAAYAELPPGVFNLVPAGLQGSMPLVEHPHVDKIAFTGSTAVGKEIARACAGTVKRLALELGGNAAAIVLDDAPAALVAQGLLHCGLINNNGQACIAQRRILVPRARQAELVDALHAAAQMVIAGDPEDPRTQLGPLVSRAHRDRVLRHIGTGLEEGATLVCGGARPPGLERGWYVAPTIFSNVHNGMHIAREEIFGPVVNVIPYDTEEQALAIAADTEYGLSGAVWSADVARAAALGKRLRVGSVYINASMTLDPNVPFGGFGQSGIGRELGPEGLAEYFEVQSVFYPATA